MNLYSKKIKFIQYLLLTVFSFYINYYFANKGLYPIDTFTFFDTGYLVTQGYHPIKDFWAISGLVADYLQGLLFLLLGYNWNAYIFHASLLNATLSIFFLFFLNNFSKNIYVNFILSISVATLCYPVAGTPFPYQHSYVLSLISILIFYLAIIKNEKKYWVSLPVIMLFSFFSMQMPAGAVNLLILFFIFVFFLKFKDYKIRFFTIGISISLFLLIFYFIFLEIDLKDFIIQQFLFPLSIGENRISGDIYAFDSATLFKKLTLRGTIGHFKFIHIFLLANLISIVIYIKKNFGIFSDRKVLIHLFIFFTGIIFIFHQLITANQTFIFSLIPVFCGFLILQLKEFFSIYNKKINLFFILLILFTTVKYNEVYNVKRKFMDLQNIDLNNAINASKISEKFNNLKWITPFHYSDNPEKEIDLLKNSISIVSNYKSDNIALITHYQFFSLITEKKLNILNRWYYPGNNTFPASIENKYFEYYNERVKKFIKNKEIKKILVVETYPKEFSFINFKILIGSNCFSKRKYNEMMYSIDINKC